MNEGTFYREKDITYDANGNIATLTRDGGTNPGIYTYTYSGNRLVTLKIGSTSYNYAYDANGNTTTDGLRGFAISYNLLNLPKKVSKGTDNIEYIYDADGNKLAKKKNGAFVNFYCGSMVYKADKSIEYIAHSEGLAMKNTAFDYQYNLTDHLGNVRTVLDASKTALQTNDYYPFGLTHAAIANVAKNKYLYNGKELQNDVLGGTAYNVLDYGARFYDAVLGIWRSPDPLAEKYHEHSPYNYCGNNPVNRIDIDGMDWYEDDDGNHKWVNSNDDEHIDKDKKKWKRKGSSISIRFGEDNYLNFYQNIGYFYKEPVDIFKIALQNDALKAELLGEGSKLSEAGKQALFNGSIHQGQWDFMEHPVTQATINGLTFVAGGGIEGISSLAKLGAGLLGKGAVIGGSQLAVQFGKTENQIYHAFRHTDALGLDRSLVQSTIQNHFKTVSSQVITGKPFNQIIKIGGQRIQYTVYKLSDGTFNIGRIHGI